MRTIPSSLGGIRSIRILQCFVSIRPRREATVRFFGGRSAVRLWVFKKQRSLQHVR